MKRSVTELMPLSAIQEAAADWCARRIGKEFTDEEERELGRWLAADPRHFREYQAMESLWNESGELADLPAIARLRSQVKEQAVAGSPGGVSAARRPRSAYLAIAASLALAAIVSLVLVTAHAPEPLQISTGLGQQKSVVLEDGTLVELDASTHLRVAHTATLRRVILDSGQAHFSVYKDPSRPFIVESGNSVVRAVGTEFQVYRRSDSVTITLLEGRVEVSRINTAETKMIADGTEQAWHERLEPGEQIVVNAVDQAVPRVAEVDIDRVTAWRRGSLDFDAVPLQDVITEINRYSIRPIHIADAGLNQVKISGIFAIGDTETMLLALEKGFDVEARPKNGHGEIFLYAKNGR